VVRILDAEMPDGYRGLTYFETRTIDLDGALSPRILFRTFCHEVLHAIEHEYEIVIPHRLVYLLEAPIERFVVDNFFKRGRK
jgi:hypothetical protein